MDGRDLPERRQHLRDRCAAGSALGSDRRAARERADQQLDAAIFRPAPRTTPAPMRRVRSSTALGVAVGFLTNVETNQGHAERRDPADHVGQAAVGDDAVAGALQRLVAEPQRRRELFGGLEILVLARDGRGRIARFLRSKGALDPAAGLVQPVLHVAKHRAVRLVAHRPPAPAAPGSPPSSRGRSARLRFPWRTASAPSIAPSGTRGGSRPASPTGFRPDPRRSRIRTGSARRRAAGRVRSRRVSVRSSARRNCGIASHSVSSNIATADRTSSSGDGRSRRTSSVSQAAAISRRSVSVSAARSASVRSGRSRLGERFGDDVVFVLQRPPHDLGRMRRDDQPDAQRADGVVQGIGRHAGRQQARQRLLDRARLRPRVRIAQVVPAPAHAVVLFGHVGQVQEMGEGAGNRHRRSDRDGAQLAGERGKALGARFVNPGAARPLREGPYALDALVERLAFLAPQRLAEEPAEQAHVVAQRLMRIVLVHPAFDDSGARAPPTHRIW